MTLVEVVPHHVGTSAVRYFPRTPFVDKRKSHSKAEGEQKERLKNNQWRLCHPSWARNPFAQASLAFTKLHNSSESKHSRVWHSLEHRCHNGAARYPTPKPTTCDVE